MRQQRMRGRLLDRVRVRLERFTADQDPAVVLDADAVAEVAALLGTVPDPAADLEIAHVAGWLFWARHQVLPDGEDQQDLTVALALFAPVYQDRPDLVPDPVRAFFDERQHSAAVTPAALHDRGVALLRETLRTSDWSALDDAVDLLRQAIDAAPADHPDRDQYLANLGNALRVRFQRGGRVADLDAAIAAGYAAVDATPADHPNRAGRLSNLSATLWIRFGQAGRVADLEAAIDVGQAAVDTSEPDHPDRARYLANLGNALQSRFERAGRVADLDAAIAAGYAAVDATPADHPNRAAILSNLGNALRIRFQRGGRVADLEAAVAAGQAAVDASPPGHPDHVRYLSNLGNTLQTRFERAGALSDLDAAITAAQTAVDAIPADHPDRARYLSNLGNALRIRFQRGGRVADLEAAVAACQAAVDVTSADRPDRARYLSNLGIALQIRFEHAGALSDLGAAIAAGQAAVDAIPADHPDRAGYSSNLGSALQIRFERTGRVADLDAAIAACQAAVDATPADHPDRARYLSNLGIALQTRFEHAGALSDLDAAIAACQAAVDATPADHPDRARYLSNLGNALRIRFERAGRVADLDAAIAARQAAVDATPADHPDRAGHLSNLGSALRIRFEEAGQVADLDAAIVAGQAAVDATPPDHSKRARYLSNLGNALRTRFERAGVLADLDAAIVAGQAAVDATPSDHPSSAMILSNLGLALQVRFERTRHAADLDAVIRVYRTGAGVVGASPGVRAGAARGWGRAAAGGGRWEEAVAGFAAAAELLGLVAPRSLARSDQEALLVELGGLGADAAACCVQAGLVSRAVALFEQGRGVLLGQALDTRTDLTALTEQHPDLAASFIRLRDVLDQADDPAVPDQPRPGEGVSGGSASGRRAAGVAFEELIASIRGLDGFETFLRPSPVDDLLATAVHGPVVAVAVSSFGSQALLLTSGGVEAVALPGLTPQTVYDQVVTFLDALADPTSGAAQRRLVEILGWLWDVLASPVLDRLHLTGTPVDGERWPRLWWCTSGLMSFLPVHAAGRHDTRFDAHPATVLDRVISSYTPTLRALTHARRTNPTDAAGGPVRLGDGRLVAIAMPQTPDASDLPGALAETTALAARFPGQTDLLTGKQATRQAVLDQLPTARWAHFACHGAANLTDPSQGQLLLADQPLTVLDITRLRLDHAQLAFLSACETARPGGRLTDEAIHLASAFQLAGYQHVIATLWPIGDRAAPDIAEDVYTTLAGTGDVATAVHTTTRRWRRRWPRTPSVWASHIHTGA